MNLPKEIYRQLNDEQKQKALQQFFTEAFDSDMGNVALAFLMEQLFMFRQADTEKEKVLRNFGTYFVQTVLGATSHDLWATKALEIAKERV